MTVFVNERQEHPRIAVSVGMLDTGFDCPGVVNIVFCRPTGSEILYKQIRGRGTRLCAGKRSFLMLDFVGNSEWFDEGYGSPGCATAYEDGHELRERLGDARVSIFLHNIFSPS